MAASQVMYAKPVSTGKSSGKMTYDSGPTKEHIPVVGHIITDDEAGLIKGEKVSPVDLNKVVKLLTDPHTALLYERHILAIGKVLRHYTKGFFLRELVQICKILNITADRVEEQPIYIESLCRLLQLCGHGFLKEKSSDELTYHQIAVESVAQIGYLFRVSVHEIRLQICKTLVSLYCEPPGPINIQDVKQTSLEYNKLIVEESDTAETLVKSLAFLESDMVVRLAVVDVLQRLSRQSASCCNQMLAAGAAQRLCSRLTDYDPSGELLFRSVECVWNLLAHGDKDEVVEQLSNQTCIGQIRDAFLYQLGRGFSHYDRQLRNDLLVLATLIATAYPQAPFLEIGFVKQLTLLATFQEVKSHNPLVKNLKLSKNHEDFEMKKLLINILVILSSDHAVVSVLAEGHLLLALFHYVKANETVPGRMGQQEWTPAYFEELQLHALAALATLAPRMVSQYTTCGGGTRALILLEWCIGPADYGGHGNSFHGTGGRGNKRAQMRHCLRFIYSMVSTGDDSVLQEFVDEGTIPMLNTILTSVSQSEEADDAIDVEMQCDMLFILSVLCETDLHRKEIFGTEGVDNLIRYLRMNPLKLSSGLGHHKLMLATVDAVWCCVVGCFTIEDYFLEKEGVFLLLDLLEGCPRNMHTQLLGCLLDLMENTKAISHVTTWRGSEDNGESAPHMLCKMWRTEEAMMGAMRQPNGALAAFDKEKDEVILSENLRFPLMGSSQRDSPLRPLPANCPSQAVVDVSENLRAKLYAIFCKIGYIDLPGVTVDDHVTLTIIERYLDFKMGEVWTEIQAELEIEDIRPISPDAEALEWIGRCVEEEAVQVARTQFELLEAQNQQDLLEEQEYYAEIRENHKQKEKALADFAAFVERTSNYERLRDAKSRQQTSIEASRIANKYKDRSDFHSTDIVNMQCTVFCSKEVKVESTPAEIFGGKLAKPPIGGGPMPNQITASARTVTTLKSPPLQSREREMEPAT